MCGRFTRKENFQQLAQLLGIPSFPALPPRYNIAPSQMTACVRTNPESLEKECVELKWGLVPSWAKAPGIGNKMINARAETVAEKPSFRKAFQQRRCLILADGFYEWKREGKAKQPYYIHFTDNRPFAFAGLWERWEAGGDAGLETCAVITTGSNTLMKPIHHRMPVILHPQHYESWLGLTSQDLSLVHALLQTSFAEGLEAYPVSLIVNNPRHDSAMCLQAI